MLLFLGVTSFNCSPRLKAEKLLSVGANGYCILMIGISMGFSAIFGQKYGRRPVMLVAVILMIAGGIWAPLTKGNVNLWIGSRVLQGLGRPILYPAGQTTFPKTASSA